MNRERTVWERGGRYAVDSNPRHLDLWREELERVPFDVWRLLGLDLLDDADEEHGARARWAKRWILQALWCACCHELGAVGGTRLPIMLAALSAKPAQSGQLMTDLPLNYEVWTLGSGVFGRVLEELVDIGARVSAARKQPQGGPRPNWEAGQVCALYDLHEAIVAAVTEVARTTRVADGPSEYFDLARLRDRKTAAYRFIRLMGPLLELTCDLSDEKIQPRAPAPSATAHQVSLSATVPADSRLRVLPPDHGRPALTLAASTRT